MAVHSQVRPMLAHTKPVEPHEINFTRGPVWVSPKYDGIRCLIINQTAKSRKLLDLPNRHVQRTLSHPLLEGMDGEVVVGSATDPNCIQNTTSGVMSRDGEPDFLYYVFDCWHTPRIGYRQRYGYVKRRLLAAVREGLPVVRVHQVLCQTVEQAEEAIAANYEAGYEGSIVRSFDDGYKYNRSTLREGYLLKVKESLDSEIHVTGFVEQMRNANEATVDELGLTKRSTHQANMIPAGTLGKLVGVDVNSGRTVTVGAGKMTAEERLRVWQRQDEYLGSFAKYRYGKHGVLDLPRFPRFIAWRDFSDL